ncbi:ribosomal RNA large subunit methyltransferase h [Mycoplasmopsis maculosa]|uniref:Ribosomal RNA large subunit methyltransferase H n=1 Tax=Mycoplasmopsis maculosa TaxID=114885 RepID=A0A449B504_9BACT|nr:23S rRNA (pseudouridine(1915)-N(3))-methyltransferase RlmH [Mycoplasmopsis maculosa]VEU75687.1 ribosomal RNA large subunit methyltransferase h [Mycoplasmopsis maculosa]
MTKIKLISVGSLSPKFKFLFEDYAKQINHFSSFSFVEIKEFSEEKNIDLKKEKETKLILESIIPNSYVILTSFRGKQFDSLEFSNIFLNNKNKDISIIIGGSDGVVEESIPYKLKLSFSNMTFPHQLFRIMLVEQIYRSYMIINNKKYHK